MKRIKTIIMGAAGRDFHDFNVLYRDNRQYEVVAFTATQIPNIDGRRYPASLAGKLYPKGIPILDESELPQLIREHQVDEVVFAYSDVTYDYVMGRSSIVNAAGAHFKLLGAGPTMLKSVKPVISVCAVRTGSGKSQTSRRIAKLLHEYGFKVAVVRHPMPYGNLAKQRVQRYAALKDLARHRCTIEEMEEYEPHIERGFLVFAGVDYGDILDAAQAEADAVLWDGGNNDLPFYRPDLHVVVADPHRVGHERSYYPGEINARLADVFVINKEDSATAENISKLQASLATLNPKATVVHANSQVAVDDPKAIAGKRVLCVEDGPTLTHGEMTYGAAVIAAQRFGAKEIVDPRPWLEGTMKDTFTKYPKIGRLLPAMGYSATQIHDLEATIARVDCDLVLIGTPIDLMRLLTIRKPAQRVRYELEEKGEPSLSAIVSKFLDAKFPKTKGKG